MKVDRLFAITNILINKKSVTAQELADEFNVSIRTIYRDIDILSANGIPIYTSQGKGGGISIIDNYSIDKTLLNDNEQKQIIMALESVKATGKEDVNDSLIKLAGLFNKKSSSWIEIDFSSWEKNDEEIEYFKIIKNSIINSTILKLNYINTNGEKSIREVEPLKLIFKRHNWYLYAYCRNKKDNRFFKLSRILSLIESQEKFDNIAPVEINKYYEEDKDNYVDIVVKIDQSMAFRVYDEFRNGKIIKENDHFIVKMNLPNNEWLFSYILSFGEFIEIVEPLDIRKRFKNMIDKINKKYL